MDSQNGKRYEQDWRDFNQLSRCMSTPYKTSVAQRLLIACQSGRLPFLSVGTPFSRPRSPACKQYGAQLFQLGAQSLERAFALRRPRENELPARPVFFLRTRNLHLSLCADRRLAERIDFRPFPKAEFLRCYSLTLAPLV